MKLKIIDNEKEHEMFLGLFRKLSAKVHKTKAEIEELKLIAHLISYYESSVYPTEPANPIVLIKMAMDFKGLVPMDLVDKIGSKAHVYNVLNKRKALSKENILILSDILNIPVNQLIVPYRLKGASPEAVRTGIRRFQHHSTGKKKSLSYAKAAHKNEICFPPIFGISA